MFHTTRKTKQKRKRKEYPRSFRFDLFSAVFFFSFFLSPDLFIKASLTMKVLTIYVYWFFLCKYNLLAWLFRTWLRACTKSFSLECELEVFRQWYIIRNKFWSSPTGISAIPRVRNPRTHMHYLLSFVLCWGHRSFLACK